MLRTIGAVAVVALLLAAATAGAQSLFDGGDIRNNTLTGADIKDGSVQVSELSRNARRALRGARGARGPRGLPGNQGQIGPVGPPGANAVGDMAYFEGPEVLVPAGDFGTAQAFCRADRFATGGGYFSSITEVFSTFVNPSNYTVLVDNTSSIAVTVQARVACVKR